MFQKKPQKHDLTIISLFQRRGSKLKRELRNHEKNWHIIRHGRYFSMGIY
jgi:hypothetical protein